MTQEPYRISFDQPEPQPQGQMKVYRGRSFGKGCLTFLFFALLVVAVVLAGIFVVYPALTPNKLRGDFLAAEVVPGKDGSYRVWIQTDGSFNYVQKITTPGKFSISRECFFCKTWTYIYDPVEKKIDKKIKTEYDDIIPVPEMFYSDGKVWAVSGTFITTEPRVNVYDAVSGEPVMDTKAFANKYSELSSGIVNLRVDNDPKRLIMGTRDGQNGVVYVVNENKIYRNEQEFRKALEETYTGEITLLALGGEDMSSPRKKLYKVTGPKNKLAARTHYESYLSNPHSMKFFLNSTSTPVNPGKIYLEGYILHQDEDCVIILHQDVAGKKANRMVTLVDISGKEKWTAPQSELFEELELDEDENPFGKIFFLKDKIGAERYAGIVVLKLEQVGLMGFDYGTGRKLWELEI